MIAGSEHIDRPDVILLNGTSSAGKSQLALALQVRESPHNLPHMS